MRLFLEISGALFWASLLLGAGWVLACKAVDWWRSRKAKKLPSVQWLATVSASDTTASEAMEKWLAAVRATLARQEAVKSRRAQEAEAKRG